jgi:uncharacterized membrane protein (DUF2068 family)
MSLAKCSAAGFRVIGALKLVSGFAALCAGLGLVHFLKGDPEHTLMRVVTHTGLDPHNQVVHSLMSFLTGIDLKHLHAIQAGTVCYALLHAVEGIGLILGYQWAGYLVVVATGLLVPFEIYEVLRRLTLVRISLLCVNALILAYLITVLRREHRRRSTG